MNNPHTFHFHHYLFLFLFVILYIPILIKFDFFVEDFMYTGKSGSHTSATAFIILMIIMYLQKYLFKKKLKQYMIPKYEDEYWNFMNNCKHFDAFPISLSKKDVKLLGSSNKLNDIKNSILQFGKVARITFILWISIGLVCRIVGLQPLHY